MDLFLEDLQTYPIDMSLFAKTSDSWDCVILGVSCVLVVL